MCWKPGPQHGGGKAVASLRGGSSGGSEVMGATPLGCIDAGLWSRPCFPGVDEVQGGAGLLYTGPSLAS
jgi:hypothetical protein